ncbi:MAG: hypothetical protein COT81_03415 [Candidatus Buchananbacteria bacterium CG10_big_fil_rev_8_21_14_0_10_42_9]|uniref:Uncharacterized protein n=1 Tax=Candidatus Buchananbacteria bacterium CG10_big_fil_rev_8_21_14_0_10_42_9 TaxID=1974526 RepID=A0A2H0W107_9BACT|nr:MAG: hypothetical protein COT81_03415 [Candidatus Buchananbacteria bacterium CG10_big_fil_rev_8_21_14_0_10_42_9]
MAQKQITPLVEDLVKQFKPTVYKEFVPPDVEKLEVSLITTKIVSFYERIRNTLDYQEEHLVRRNGIARYLRRMIIVEGKRKNLAQTLLTELIRTKYLENKKVPVTKIPDIEKIIDKYLYLIEPYDKTITDRKSSAVVKWLIAVMACEIEEKLFPLVRDRATVMAMYQYLKTELVYVNNPLPEQERDVQLYLTVWRGLIKSDHPLLRYELLKLYYPDWNNPSAETSSGASAHLEKLIDNIDRQIKNPFGEKLTRFLKKHNIYFSILRDVLMVKASDSMATVSDTGKLSLAVEDACNTRYKEARKKLHRSVVRSVLYIFITKMTLGLILEVPYDLIVYGSVIFTPLIINIVFHPVLMFLITIPISVPSKKNTQKIVKGVSDIIYGEKSDKLIYKHRRSSVTLNFFFGLFYLLMFAVSFGIIITILRRLDFSVLSGFLFLLFLSIISFFAIRIRYHAKELVVLDRRDGILSFLFDILTLPILRAGRWVSMNSQKINIFIFILDNIIEAPLKMVVSGVEELTGFVKEKKEELQ